MTEKKKGRQAAQVAEQTRQLILDTALQLFIEQGFEGANLRDIAMQAGTTHGLLYHHFGSKEGLWQAVVDRALARYTTALLPSIEQANRETDPVPAMKEIVRSFLRISAAFPESVHLMLNEGGHASRRLDYLLDGFAPIGRSLEPAFKKAQQQGHLRPFTNETIFLFLLTGGIAPFALSALSSKLIGAAILSQEQVEQHIARTLDLLFPVSSSSRKEN